MAKKNMSYSNKELRSLVDVSNKEISIMKQCSLINLARSSFYYKPREIALEQIKIMHKIDRIYTEHPLNNITVEPGTAVFQTVNTTLWFAKDNSRVKTIRRSSKP